MTSSDARNYVHRTKCKQKPFSFRWEIEHAQFRLPLDGEFESPDFEVADGIWMSASLERKKVDDEDWVSVGLILSDKSRVKKAFVGSSFAFLRSTPNREPLRVEERVDEYEMNHRWFIAKFVTFTELIDPTEHFLSDGHLLTVLVEGHFYFKQQPVDKKQLTFDGDEGSADELEARLCKQTTEKIRKMLDEGVHTDFVVRARDAKGRMKELKVHKAFLATGSEVFAAMLEKREVKECREGVLEVEDIGVEAMRALIRFLYTGKLGADACKSIELDLLLAADKYQMEEFKNLIEHRLSSALSVNNVCGWLAHADRLKAAHLKAKCAEFIRRRRKAVVKTGGWRQLCTPEYAHLVGTALVGVGAETEGDDGKSEGEEEDDEGLPDDEEENEEVEANDQPSTSAAAAAAAAAPNRGGRPKRRCTITQNENNNKAENNKNKNKRPRRQ